MWPCRGKHLAEGATLVLVPIVEAGEGVGARQLLGPGLLANSGPTCKESENLRLKGLKKQCADEPATPSLREGTREPATLEQH